MEVLKYHIIGRRQTTAYVARMMANMLLERDQERLELFFDHLLFRQREYKEASI